MHAVVPVAGLGTRLLPLTRVVPKALLPLDDRPVVQHIVDELLAVGISCVWLVVRPEGPAIEEQFAGDPRIRVLHQPKPLGLGDAIARAAPVIGDDPFVVALGDGVFRTPAALRALLGAFGVDRRATGAIAVERVPRERLARCGVLSVEGSRVVGIVEKPAPEEAPSDLAVAARYVLSREIFDALRSVEPGPDGEIGLTEALARLIADGRRVLAVPLPEGERRYDVGDPNGYAEAFVEFALARDAGLAERVRGAGER